MAYNNAIPQAPDKFKNSYSQMQSNFNAVNNALLGVDLGGILFTNQPTDPATSGTQMALYSRIAQNVAQTGSFTNTLCVRQNTSGSVFEFTGGVAGIPGWTRLPNGMLIKWMQITIPENGDDPFDSYAQTWPVATNIPVFTAIPVYYNIVQIPSIVTTANAYIQGVLSSTAFNIKVTTTNYSLSGGWNSFDIVVTAFGQG